ncbi:UTP--glucose-1-phosphate uridylyltransferase [Candidatus Poribacteria bacterium]|nr:UTP--glucose-1-phosphate uridylyltransferase [Candidatus Poribacteria bacterium]
MNKVKKAVIPVAGYGTRLYPASKAIKKELFPIVDRDGMAKPLIQVIIEEGIDSGIEEVCLVIREDERDAFTKYFDEPVSPELEKRLADRPWAVEETQKIADLSQRISYIIQKEQQGFGHAVYCANEWVGNEPFLLMLGDHVYVSNNHIRCVKQLIDIFLELGGNTCAVMRTLEHMLHLFGTVAGKQIPGKSRVYEVREIKEKPSVEYAEMHLQTDSLPLGEYLCFFGQYILTPDIFEYIKYLIDKNIRERGEIQLTSALEMARKDTGVFYAYETDGQRYDTGVPLSYANTVNAFAEQTYARRTR